jgi:hypothetical protein
MCWGWGAASSFPTRVTQVSFVPMASFTMLCNSRPSSQFCSRHLSPCRAATSSPARRALRAEPSPLWTLAAGRGTRVASGRSCCRRWVMCLGGASGRTHKVRPQHLVSGLCGARGSPPSQLLPSNEPFSSAAWWRPAESTPQCLAFSRPRSDKTCLREKSMRA